MYGQVPEDSFPRLALMNRSIPSTLEGVIALRHSQSPIFSPYSERFRAELPCLTETH